MLKYTSFTKLGYCIKSVTQYDNCFDTHRGTMQFLPINPRLIVEVYITAESFQSTITSVLQDLHMYISNDFGDHLAITKILDIKEKKEAFLTICTIQHRKNKDTFLLDVDSLVVITPEMFTERLPINDVSALFIFSDDASQQIYNVINPLENLRDSQLFSWFLSVIYGRESVIGTLERPTLYSKVFLQALTAMIYSEGRGKPELMDGVEVNAAKFGTISQYSTSLPGGVNRFAELMQSKQKKGVGRHVGDRI